MFAAITARISTMALCAVIAVNVALRQRSAFGASRNRIHPPMVFGRNMIPMRMRGCKANMVLKAKPTNESILRFIAHLRRDETNCRSGLIRMRRRCGKHG